MGPHECGGAGEVEVDEGFARSKKKRNQQGRRAVQEQREVIRFCDSA